MYSDILHFAINHNCNIIYRSDSYISYQIKYIDHHFSCKSVVYKS